MPGNRSGWGLVLEALRLLTRQEMSTSDLMEALAMSRDSVERLLGTLVEEGVNVQSRKVSRFVYHRVSRHELRRVMGCDDFEHGSTTHIMQLVEPFQFNEPDNVGIEIMVTEVRKECAALDAENAALRAEVDALKAKLAQAGLE